MFLTKKTNSNRHKFWIILNTLPWFKNAEKKIFIFKLCRCTSHLKQHDALLINFINGALLYKNSSWYTSQHLWSTSFHFSLFMEHFSKKNTSWCASYHGNTFILQFFKLFDTIELINLLVFKLFFPLFFFLFIPS